MSHAILVGSTNPIMFFRAFDTDGTAKVNLLAAEAGLALSVYRAGGSSVAISSLSDKAADDTAHADGAIRQVGSGNLYTVDAPDAAVASQFGAIAIKGSYTAGVIEGVPHPLVGYDGSDGVRFGITSLPNAAADAAGGLPISDAGGLDMDAQRTDVAAVLVDTGTTIPTTLGTPANADLAADIAAIAGASPYPIVERSPGDTNAITFVWPVATGTVTVSHSIDGAVTYTAATGTASFLRTDGTRHLWTFTQHADDRPATEGTARYKMVGSGYTKYVNLRVEGASTDAAGIRAAIGMSAADLDTQLGDIPTVAEFNARTLVASSYFDPATDVVANVTLVDTTTTNSDMRGTDGANTAAPPTAAAVADAVLDEAMSGHTAADSLGLFLNDQYDLAITGITTGVETRAGKHSVAATVMMSTNAALSGGTLTAKKPSDDTTFSTYTVTTDAAANNITGMS